MNMVNSSELYEAISSYPEEERDGRSDLQMVADEVSYIISCINEDGHVFNEETKWAQTVNKETKGGKVMPYYTGTLMPKYSGIDVRRAKEILNENRRLKSCMKRLNDAGYYGQW